MKLSLKIGLITAIVAGVIAIAVFLNHSFWEGKAWRADLKAHASTMADMLNLSVQESLLQNDFSSLEYYLDQFRDRKDLAYVVVYDNVATPLASTKGKAAEEAMLLYQANSTKHRKDIHSHQIYGRKIYELLIPVIVQDKSWGTMQIGFYEDEILSAYQRTKIINYLILALGLLACLVAGWGVARYIGKPIEALTDGVDQLAKNNFNYRIKYWRKDELGKLVTAFNEMSGTISRNFIELEAKNQELYQAQERQMWLSRIAEQVGDGVAVADLEGMITFVNQSWVKMHGYDDPRELLGKHLSISHSHLQLEKEVIPFNQVVLEKGVNTGLVGHIKKDRTVFYTEMTSTLLKNPEGRPVGFIGVARDITIQKQMQDELRRERDLVKSIFASSPDAIVIMNLQGFLTDCNQKAIELVGAKAPSDLIGKNYLDFVHPDDRDLAVHSLQKTLDYDQVNNLQLTAVDARQRTFPMEYSIRLVRTADGQPFYMIGICRDISARKKVEQALSDSEERFRNMAENIDEGMAIIENGKVVFVNKRACQIYGCTAEDITRFNSVTIAAPEEKDRVRKVVEQAKNSGLLPKHLEFWIMRPDGQRRFVQYRYYGNINEGEKKGYFVVFSDITERKLAEDALRENESRLRTLGDNLPGGLVYQIDSGPDGSEREIVHISAGVKALHGLSPEQVISDSKLFYDQVLEQDRRIVAEAEAECLKRKTPLNIEVRVKLPNGETRWRRFSSAPRLLDNGHLIWDGIEIDVTDRKLAEQSLKELTERFEYALGATKTGFDIIDEDYNIIYIDPSWQKTYGPPAGRKCYQYFVDRADPCQDCGMRKAIADSTTVVTEQYRKKDDRWVEVHTIPFQDASGKWMVAEFNIDITERKISLESIRNSEQRYRALAEASPDIIFVIDREGSIKYANSRAASIVGLTSEQASGRNIAEFFPQHLNDRQKEQLLDVFKNGQTAHYELPTTVRDRELWLETWLVPLYDAEGRVAEVMGLCRDLTERKKAEEDLRQSEEKYRELADHLPQTVFEIDQQGLVTYVNKTGFDQFGYDSRDLASQLSALQLLAPEDRERAQANIVRRLAGGMPENQEYKALRKDGTTFPINIYSHPVRKNGMIVGLRGLIVDITEQKKAEAAIRESEAKFRALAETSPAAIVAYREKFIYANPAAEKLTGYTAEEIKNKYFWEAVHPDFLEMIKQKGEARIKGDPTTTHFEFKLIRKDGQVRWVDFTGTLAMFEGQPAGMGMAIDITERKAIEEILEASEAQYRSTIDSFSDAVHVVDLDFNILLANAAFKTWCHDFLQTDDVIGRNIFELCNFLTHEVRSEYQKVITSGKVVTTQEYNIVGDQLISTETRKIPILEDGKVIKIITVMRDVSKEKDMTFRLEETEQKYRQVLEGVSEGIYRTTPEGRILLANQAIVKMLGYDSMEELMSRDINREGYPDPKMRKRFIEAMQKQGRVKNWVSEWKRKDGSNIVMRENAHVVKDNTGKIMYYEGTVEDITDQVKAQQKLLETERKYYQIFENIVEGIYRSTPDGKLLLANPALVKMLGFNSFEEMANIDLNKTGYMDSRARKRFKELMERDGQVLGFEARWRRSDGKILIISENSRAVRDKNGKILYYEGTIEDITERQLAQEELLNEKNKIADLFRVSLQVAKANDIQKKLDLTMDGIQGTGLFGRAVLVLKNDDGSNRFISHFGMSEREVKAILKASPTDSSQIKNLFSSKYRYSNSYFIPHDATGVNFSIKLTNKKYKITGDWHPDDVLIVPLMVQDKHIGYLTVDEPTDGKVPNLETVRLLELFAYQAAVAVDNLRLYNDLERSYYSTLKAFVAAMDAKDPYTKGHSENVRFHALKIARRLGLSEEQVRLVDFSSLLHDIGKLAIRDEILTKPSLLSDHEFQEVKLHPVIGSQLVSEIESLNRVAPIIHSHHEHFDGSGYPLGIKGEDIPLESRIIAVADAFEAMTSDRPYRKAFDYKIAIKRLKDAAGTQFDAEIVRVFIKLHQEAHDKKS